MSQMTLGDVLAPQISGVEGARDRPTRWLVSYPDGRIVECRRAARPGALMIRDIYADGTADAYHHVDSGFHPHPGSGRDTSD